MLALLGRKQGLVVSDPDATVFHAAGAADGHGHQQDRRRGEDLRQLFSVEAGRGTQTEAEKEEYNKKLVTIGLGDGQIVLTFSYLKRRWPEP